jgi:hypothetical protein
MLQQIPLRQLSAGAGSQNRKNGGGVFVSFSEMAVEAEVQTKAEVVPGDWVEWLLQESA